MCFKVASSETALTQQALGGRVKTDQLDIVRVRLAHLGKDFSATEELAAWLVDVSLINFIAVIFTSVKQYKHNKNKQRYIKMWKNNVTEIVLNHKKQSLDKELLLYNLMIEHSNKDFVKHQLV